MADIPITWATRILPLAPLLEDSHTQARRASEEATFAAQSPAPTEQQMKAFRASVSRKYGPNWRLAQSFTVTNVVPWQATPGLPSTVPVTRQRLWRAALNSGYGIFRQSQETIHEDERASWSVDGFAEAWKRRATDLAGYVNFVEGLPCAFWKRLEKSDKLLPSFGLGSAFCRLVAEAWLAAGGRKVRAYWHYGIYGPALLHPSRDWYKTPGPIHATGSTPDYLVIDDHGEPHLFESKAGTHADSWKRLERGLFQLEEIQLVHLVSQPLPQAPTSSVAVYTSVEADKEISIKAYDPPKPEMRTDFLPPPEGLLWVHDDVAFGMSAVEALDLFGTLEHAPSFAPGASDDLLVFLVLDQGIEWKQTLGGWVGWVLDSEQTREVRQRLEMYLAVRAALPNRSNTRSRHDDVRWKIPLKANAKLSERVLGASYGYLMKALDSATTPNELLVELARALDLGSYRETALERLGSVRLALQRQNNALRFDVQDCGLVYLEQADERR